MALTGGAIVVRALHDEGITHAFGIPGTHNIELYDALGASDIRPVLITDEQSAGFLADGYWRATGRMACLNLVPGAGLTHALSGIAEAFMDGVPLLVLGCGIRQDVRRAYQLHDIDQLALVRPVVKGAFRPMTGAELYPAIRQACALARSGTPGPVMVEVPVNLYLQTHDVTDWSAPAPAVPTPSVTEDILRQAASLLTAPGARPMLYLGLGAAGAGADLVRLAERLEARVTTTFSGKGVFPESHPLFVWNGFGNQAPEFARTLVDESTVTLAIGCRFGEVATGSYGLTPPGALIHVDIAPEVLGANYPATVPVVAEASAFVTALLARLGPGGSEDSALRTRIRDGHGEVRTGWRERRSEKVSPFALFTGLQEVFGPDAVYSTDSGNGTFLAMEMLRLDRPNCFLAPVDYSCMGYSVPAAIGAKLAAPERPVIALPGDGAFLMTGLELLTAANQQVGVAVFVLRDRELAQIAQFQATAMNRKSASVLPDYDASMLAQALGVEAMRLDRDAEIGTVLERVRRVTGEGRPVLVDVAIDYSEKTYFTKGVVKTTLLRLPWKDRLRFIGRAVGRKIFG